MNLYIFTLQSGDRELVVAENGGQAEALFAVSKPNAIVKRVDSILKIEFECRPHVVTDKREAFRLGMHTADMHIKKGLK